MDFAEWTNALQKTIDILESERETICLQISSDTMALLKRRIINDRKDSEGGDFGTYSEAVVPFWYYKGKESKSDAERLATEMYEDTGYWASYQDWREVNNLEGDKINFSFTGEMWKSVVPVTVKNDQDSIVIGVISNNQKHDEKLGYQINRFPKLLDLDGKEESLMQRLNQARIDKAFKKAGLL